MGEDDSDPRATESTRAVNQLAPDADVDDLDGNEGSPATVPARPRASRGDEAFAFGFVRVRDVSRTFGAAFGACSGGRGSVLLTWRRWPRPSSGLCRVHPLGDRAW